MVNQSVISSFNIIGNIIYLGVFFSPAPTLYGIRKKKAVEEFSPVPYLAALLTCAVWVFYGMPFMRNSLLDVIINAVGLVFEIVYLTIFFIYANKEGRKKFLIWLLGEAVLFVAIVLITMLAIYSVSERTVIVAGICNILNVVASVSPLTIIEKIRKTKSVKYMPFWLSLTRFFYGLCWTIYTLIFPLDKFALFCNGIGVISEAVQLLLYGYYWYKGNDQTAT